MVVWASAVHPRNRVAAWELWLTAAAQHQERGSEYLLSEVSIVRRSTFETQHMASTECVTPSHHSSQKIVGGTI